MLATTLLLAAALGLPVVGRAQAGSEEGRVRRLTETGARNGQAFFSPTADRVSFISNRSGSWQVWVMRPDGADARRVTDGATPASWPSWRADGRTLLYYAMRDERYRILEVSIESGAPTRLFDGLDGDAFRPLLSPDGGRLLFDRVSDSDRPNHDLFALDRASGEVRQLTHDAGYDSDARWSPDGKRIVFHSDRGAEALHTQVFVMGADDLEVTALTHGPAVHGYPSWSPDGKRIAYTRELDGNRDIWVMNANGSAPERLTFHSGFDGDPVFAPDGTRLLFSTDRFGGQELASIRLGDSDATR